MLGLIIVIVAVGIILIAVLLATRGIPTENFQVGELTEQGVLPIEFDFKFNIPFKSVPSVVSVSTKNNTSGKQCETQVVDVTTTGLTTISTQCESPGYQVGRFIQPEFSENTYSMASFTVNGESVPAVVYWAGGYLLYSLAKNKNGTQWNAPVFLTSSFTYYVCSRLLNIDNRPALAFIEGLNTKYIQGTDPTFTTFQISSTITVPSVALFSIALSFNSSSQPVVFVADTSRNVFSYVSTTNGASWNSPVTVFSALTGSGIYGIDSIVSNSKMSVVVATGTGSMVFKTSTDENGSVWPGSSATLATNVNIFNRPQLFVFNNLMSVLYQKGSKTTLLQSNDISGLSWSSTGYQVNSTITGALSTASSVVVSGDKLGLAFINESKSIYYGVYTAATLSTITSNTNNVLIDNSGVPHELMTTLVDGGIAFGYIDDLATPTIALGDLRYFRPLTGTLEVTPSFTSTYSVYGAS